MPRVKLEYVVSFSSEDSENPASNLLQWDISKKKWLCPRGEPQCSVVLQLEKSTKISAVHIGAYQTASVEVLVGRSETPNDQFQVLVPSSIFLSPIESRKEENVEKVRSFSSEQFAEAARNQKWDRIRVVCSQPYNKHCKYGLSFIQIYEPESSDNPVSTLPPMPTTSAVPPRLFSLDTHSSDEDEFKPGQLFATHLQSTSVDSQNRDTGAQIRQATSQALKNISDTSSKLVRTPIAKTAKRPQDVNDSNRDRKRDSLLYEEEDDKPHAKIDHVVQRHKDENSRNDANGKVNKGNTGRGLDISAIDDKSKQSKPKLDSSIGKDKDKHVMDSKNKVTAKARLQSDNLPSYNHHTNGEKESKKRPRSEKKDKEKESNALRPGPVSDSPHTLMRDVVFVLSGYENPKRSFLRTAALAMGASCQRDWGPLCTHLICAFPNTPKLKQVRASANGAHVPVVKGEWIEECAAKRRLLPWQWYATEPNRYVAPTTYDEDLTDGPNVESDCDTDDEIEKVLNKQKRQRVDKSPSPAASTPPDVRAGNTSRESDIQFVKDERVQGNITIQESDSDATDEDKGTDETITIDESKSLPDFFEGYTFLIDNSVAESKVDAQLLARYVRAYGGLLVQNSELDEESSVDYVLCGGGAKASASNGLPVRADWVWKCHEQRRLAPTDQYLVS